MLRIRLSRGGKKKQPHYRVVVANIQSKRDGRIVERLGYYNPLTDPSTYKINEGRALYWLSVGAQPSDAVRRLLDKQGTIERLGRLRAGESLDRLVAEYEGVPYVEETAEEVEEAPAEETSAEETSAEETSVEEAPVEEASEEETPAGEEDAE